MFDILVVTMSVVEIIADLAGQPLRLGIRVLKTLRGVRIIRLMRSLNRFEVFCNLKTMIYALTGSISSFLAAIIILGCVMYVFALVFMSGARGYLRGTPDPAMIPLLDLYWGSLDKSFWTLIGAVTGGHDWIPVAEPIVEFGPVYVFFFLSYIAFILFGLLNIMNGVFVNAAMQANNANRELAVNEIMNQQEHMTEGMVSLFLEADDDQSGTLSMEEFHGYMNNEKIIAYFRALELDMSDAERIFMILDADNTGQIELMEFVHGCIRLRGTAKIIDAEAVQMGVDALIVKMDKLEVKHDTTFTTITDALNELKLK